MAIITGLAEDVGAIADGILAFLERCFQAVHSSGRERGGELGEIGVLHWHGLAVRPDPAGDHNQILQLFDRYRGVDHFLPVHIALRQILLHSQNDVGIGQRHAAHYLLEVAVGFGRVRGRLGDGGAG